MDGAVSGSWPPFACELAPALTDTHGEVLVWGVTSDASDATITDQFKANADEYHRRYAASDHFEALFRQALAASGITVPDRPGSSILVAVRA